MATIPGKEMALKYRIWAGVLSGNAAVKIPSEVQSIRK